MATSANLATSDDGFTLVEVLIAFAIFITGSLCAGIAIVELIQATGLNRDRILATNIARDQVDALRLQSSTGHQLSAATATPSRFTVSTTMNPLATAACSAGSVRAVTVSVSWTAGATRIVSLNTELAC